jgi:predicted house-cleaning noncanonical NTP pyrophosphatase (MazG superfamily)
MTVHAISADRQTGRKNMKTIKYDKLVRDKIPEIIESSGKKCTVEVMDNETYIAYLDRKLDEELKEYQADKSIEELADLLEVMYAVAVARGYSVEELEKIRKDKADKRGAFEKRLILKEVSEVGD